MQAFPGKGLKYNIFIAGVAHCSLIGDNIPAIGAAVDGYGASVWNGADDFAFCRRELSDIQIASVCDHCAADNRR